MKHTLTSLVRSGKRSEYKIRDRWGERTLVVPPEAPWHSGDPTRSILETETATGTRLRDGADPLRFWRIHLAWKEKRQDAASGISFADYCEVLHPDLIERSPGKLPADALMLREASAKFCASVSTLRRAIRDKRLKRHRIKGVRLDYVRESEVAKHFTRR